MDNFNILLIGEKKSLGTKIIYNKLRYNGFNVVLHIYENMDILLNMLDINFTYDTLAESVDFLKSKKFSLILVSYSGSKGIYEMLTHFDYLKWVSNCKWGIGGHNATYDYEYFKELGFDYIIGGEGEGIIVDLCKKVMNGIDVGCYDYLFNEATDLSDYDYEHNYIIDDGTLYIETSRSCPRLYSSRCSYCTGFKEKYRLLDIDKIINVCKGLKFDNIMLCDSSPRAESINRLYDEFGCCIGALVDPYIVKDLKVKNCDIFVGCDYPLMDNKWNPNKPITLEIFENILNLSKTNNVCISHVYEDPDEIDFDFIRSFSHYHIVFQMNKFYNFPGVSLKSSNKNIYKKFLTSQYIGIFEKDIVFPESVCKFISDNVILDNRFGFTQRRVLSKQQIELLKYFNTTRKIGVDLLKNNDLRVLNKNIQSLIEEKLLLKYKDTYLSLV